MEVGLGNVHPDCPNAANPFHECTAHCFDVISSGHPHRKDKRLFGFGKKNPIKNTPPSSPARVIAGNRSPLPSYYRAKKKVESDDSPSYSSSDDYVTDNFVNRRTPQRGQAKNLSRYNVAAENDSLPMSPSLAVYTERDPFTSRLDPRRGTDPDMSPRTSTTRPMTPDARSGTPERHFRATPEHRPRSRTPEARPRTPDHEQVTPETRPRTPDTRPRTPEHYFRATPEHQSRPRTPDREQVTPETRPRTPDTRPRTPEHYFRATPEHQSRPRTPDREQVSHETRPRTPDTRPRTPEHYIRATPEYQSRPRTPDREQVTPETRPRTPDTRPMTVEYRVRSPDRSARSAGPRSRTPEPQARYLEPRARTPEPRARTPEPGPRIPRTQPTFRDLAAGQRSPRAYNPVGNKADSVYTDDDDESVLLYPELLLSPQERPASRPITPERRGKETPTKQEEMAESESSDDNFSFVDDDRSVLLHPEIVSSDLKPKSGSSTPVHHKLRTSSGEQEENLKNNEPPELPDESQSFTLSEITRMRGLKHYETQSIISESYVSVGNYKVRSSLSAALQYILDKHGDIASGSKLQSLPTRSYYLETVATIVLELQSTPLRELKETRVAEMLTMVKDVESVKIRAGWLRSLLEEVLEAAKHFDRHEATVVEKEACEGEMVNARKEMEGRMKELETKEKETKECRERVTVMGGKLGMLEMKRQRLEKSLGFLSSKVDKFQGKSVMEDIL
ncbi:PREDICTED: serine/arginine repetitive matrix protein 1 isoform X2 [Tarenaya hassleriana]|uniref:serine/arginine repetitive matrix protein 1 isoform X2 n=1 Tax=Tarenaya hassleriana TaxID=28532 RepID=UPI00053C0ECD|nr:PREDICTED: serine/arginine repetitive matrix protein 1 isoform X2 [Tarenaya hassleriana]